MTGGFPGGGGDGGIIGGRAGGDGGGCEGGGGGGNGGAGGGDGGGGMAASVPQNAMLQVLGRYSLYMYVLVSPPSYEHVHTSIGIEFCSLQLPQKQ